MPDQMRIELEVAKIGDAVGAINAVGMAGSDLVKVEEALAVANRDLAASLKGLKNLPAPAGGGKGAGGPSYPRVSGPWQQKARAEAALSAAQTPDERMDAQYAGLLAQRRVDRALTQMQPPAPDDLGKRLAKALMSTRFGMGGVSPIVGRSLDVLFPGIHKAVWSPGAKGLPTVPAGPAGAAPTAGGGAAAGVMVAEALLPVALAATAAAGSIKMMDAAVEAATRELRQLRQAVAMSGGTTGEVSRLAGMGIPDIPGQSAALRERLATDPMAMAAGQRVGIGYQMPRPFGTANEAELLLKALEGLRQIRDAEEQLRVARALGLEGMIDQIRVSDDVWQAMKADAALRAQIANPAYQQAARDFDAELRRLQTNFKSLEMVVGQPVIALAADALAVFNDGMRTAAAVIKPVSDLATKYRMEIVGVMVPIVGFVDKLSDLARSLGWLKDLDKKEEERRQEQALRENNERLRELSRAIEKGIWGGGARARSAMPAGWSGPFLEAVADKEALLRGWF